MTATKIQSPRDLVLSAWVARGFTDEEGAVRARDEQTIAWLVEQIAAAKHHREVALTLASVGNAPVFNAERAVRLEGEAQGYERIAAAIKASHAPQSTVRASIVIALKALSLGMPHKVSGIEVTRYDETGWRLGAEDGHPWGAEAMAERIEKMQQGGR